ncbi:DUF4145 domain-containing protein [Clostridioides difficile]|nr:DUF4145 domain-containing protein [Clostridioides difficile]
MAGINYISDDNSSMSLSREELEYNKIASNFGKYKLEKLRRCPRCGDGIDPIYRINAENDFDLVVVYLCPLCREMIVVKYMPKLDMSYSDEWQIAEIYPKGSRIRKFPDSIKEISSRFCNVYKQAESALNNDLDEICGMGFRKALEVLVKDYLTNDNCKKAIEALDKLKQEIDILDETEKESKIKEIGKNSYIAKYIKGSPISAKDVVLRSTLEKCIDYCVSDPRIVSCANKARRIGNDETHYEKKLDEVNTYDLKILIDLTINWIDTEYLTEMYENKFEELKSK